VPTRSNAFTIRATRATIDAGASEVLIPAVLDTISL
jgi:hypothetical protein